MRDINTLAKRIISEIQGTVGQLNSKIKEKPLGPLNRFSWGDVFFLEISVAGCIWKIKTQIRDSCLDTLERLCDGTGLLDSHWMKHLLHEQTGFYTVLLPKVCENGWSRCFSLLFWVWHHVSPDLREMVPCYMPSGTDTPTHSGSCAWLHLLMFTTFTFFIPSGYLA